MRVFTLLAVCIAAVAGKSFKHTSIFEYIYKISWIVFIDYLPSGNTFAPCSIKNTIVECVLFLFNNLKNYSLLSGESGNPK